MPKSDSDSTFCSQAESVLSTSSSWKTWKSKENSKFSHLRRSQRISQQSTKNATKKAKPSKIASQEKWQQNQSLDSTQFFTLPEIAVCSQTVDDEPQNLLLAESTTVDCKKSKITFESIDLLADLESQRLSNEIPLNQNQCEYEASQHAGPFRKAMEMTKYLNRSNSGTGTVYQAEENHSRNGGLIDSKEGTKKGTKKERKSWKTLQDGRKSIKFDGGSRRRLKRKNEYQTFHSQCDPKNSEAKRLKVSTKCSQGHNSANNSKDFINNWQVQLNGESERIYPGPWNTNDCTSIHSGKSSVNKHFHREQGNSEISANISKRPTTKAQRNGLSTNCVNLASFPIGKEINQQSQMVPNLQCPTQPGNCVPLPPTIIKPNLSKRPTKKAERNGLSTNSVNIEEFPIGKEIYQQSQIVPNLQCPTQSGNCVPLPPMIIKPNLSKKPTKKPERNGLSTNSVNIEEFPMGKEIELQSQIVPMNLQCPTQLGNYVPTSPMITKPNLSKRPTKKAERNGLSTNSVNLEDFPIGKEIYQQSQIVPNLQCPTQSGNCVPLPPTIITPNLSKKPTKKAERNGLSTNSVNIEEFPMGKEIELQSQIVPMNLQCPTQLGNYVPSSPMITKPNHSEWPTTKAERNGLSTNSVNIEEFPMGKEIELQSQIVPMNLQCPTQLGNYVPSSPMITKPNHSEWPTTKAERNGLSTNSVNIEEFPMGKEIELQSQIVPMNLQCPTQLGNYVPSSPMITKPNHSEWPTTKAERNGLSTNSVNIEEFPMGKEIELQSQIVPMNLQCPTQLGNYVPSSPMITKPNHSEWPTTKAERNGLSTNSVNIEDFPIGKEIYPKHKIVEMNVRCPTRLGNYVPPPPMITKPVPLLRSVKNSILPKVYPPHFVDQKPPIDASQAGLRNIDYDINMEETYPTTCGWASLQIAPELSTDISVPNMLNRDATEDSNRLYCTETQIASQSSNDSSNGRRTPSECSQLVDDYETLTSSSPSLPDSLKGIFDSDDLREILNVGRVEYRLRESHLKALSVVLDIGLEYLRDVIQHVVTLDESILKKLECVMTKT